MDIEELYNQALIHEQSGDYQEAIKCCNQLLKIDSTHTKALCTQGIARAVLGDNEAAIKDLNQAINIDTQLAKAYYYRGLIYHYALGEYHKAIKDYNSARRINPNNYEILIKLANAKVLIGKVNEASKFLNKVPPLLFLNNVDFHENWGRIHWCQNNYSGAIAKFTEALNIDSNNANVYWYRGLVYFDSKDYQSAIADFTQALLINPNNANAYFLLNDADAYCCRGIAYHNIGNLRVAEENYTQAIKINSNLVQAYYNRGLVRSLLGKKQEALTDFTQAININPDLGDAYYNRGLVRFQLGEQELGIEDCLKAIRVNPNLFMEVIRTISNSSPAVMPYVEGFKRFISKDYPNAIENLNQAINADPDFLFAYLLRGLARHKQRDIEGAITDYSHILRNAPNLAPAYVGRGLVLLQQKKLQEAIQDFCQAETYFLKQAEYFSKQCEPAKSEKILSLIRILREIQKQLKQHTTIQNLVAPLIQQTLENYLTQMLSDGKMVLLSEFKKEILIQQERINILEKQVDNLESVFTDFQQQITETLKSATVNLSSFQAQLDNFASAITGIPNQVNEAIEMRVAEINQLLKTIQPYQYELVINRDGSRSQLIKAAKEADYQLLIVCPWLHWGVRWNNNELIDYFRAFLAKNQNGCIDIGWGHYQDIESVKNKSGSIRGRLKAHYKLYSALDNLEKLEMDYQSRFRLKLIGTHEKFLVCDDKFAMLGSHNFLSSGDKSAEREVGIYTTDPRIIQQLKNQFEKAKNLEKDNN
jgi:tetratricopeptide (TPR) repeat protein